MDGFSILLMIKDRIKVGKKKKSQSCLKINLNLNMVELNKLMKNKGIKMVWRKVYSLGCWGLFELIVLGVCVGNRYYLVISVFQLVDFKGYIWNIDRF